MSNGPNLQDVVARVVQFDTTLTESSPPPDPSILVRQTQQAHAPPEAVAREKPAKFSKSPRCPKAAEGIGSLSGVAAAATVQSKAIVNLPVAADVQAYLKLAKLPAASSFFYETPETVCLPDDRLQVTNTAVQPWNINCQLVITFQDDTQAVGTGWFYGPRLVVTAGHCVHEGAGGNYFKSVEVIPGMNGAVRPFGSMHSMRLAPPMLGKPAGQWPTIMARFCCPGDLAHPEDQLPATSPPQSPAMSS